MTRRWSLRRRITGGVIAYAIMLSAAVFGHGFVVNESAEQLVWSSLLHAELDHYIARSADDPDYRWPGTETMELFVVEPGRRAVAPLDLLQPGVHDDIVVAGRERVVLVQDVGTRRLILALDIGALERSEEVVALSTAASATLAVVLLACAVAWGIGRLVRPLSELAERIGALQPDAPGQRIALPAHASGELEIIADALNAYLQRNERFVLRERAFIDSASHELRTPIAVIAGASELALGRRDLPDAARRPLERILRTARDVEQLIALLLVLAKDPARLRQVSERFALDQRLPQLVDDHRHLCEHKDLAIVLAPLPPCELFAPWQIVQAAVGNLLRNAIENSDRGEIRIALSAAGVVVIEDPGHGMTPEEISAIHARIARGPARDGGGIGLELIGRLCEHLGWRLAIESAEGAGTRVTLDLGASVAAGAGPAAASRAVP